MSVNTLLNDLNTVLEKYGFVVNRVKRETPVTAPESTPDPALAERKRKAGRLRDLISRKQ